MTEIRVLLTYGFACVCTCHCSQSTVNGSLAFRVCVCVCIIPVFASQCVNTVLCAFYLSQRLSAFALAPLSLANLNCATDRMR